MVGGGRKGWWGGKWWKEQLRFGWDEKESGEWNVSGLVGAADGTWKN